MTELTEELIRAMREESERTKDLPYPPGTRGRRLNRENVFSLRLTDEEQKRLAAVAQAQHLPASTMARSWILQRLEQESAQM